jgi:hypothetical protein
LSLMCKIPETLSVVLSESVVSMDWTSINIGNSRFVDVSLNITQIDDRNSIESVTFGKSNGWLTYVSMIIFLILLLTFFCFIKHIINI